MQLTRILKVAAILGAFLVAVVLGGIKLSEAGEPSPDQLLLKLSELPIGAHVQIQGPLIPGSQGNGMVNRDGTDIVQGYTTGARVDFITPLVQVKSTSGEQSMAQSYIGNFVYRFSDERAAAIEFQRLKDMFSSHALAAPVTNIQSPGRQSVKFQIGDGEISYATMQWLFVQRGKFLIILAIPGPLQQTANGVAKQSADFPLTDQAAVSYNTAVEKLFGTSKALLENR